jgi:hypothetical protein
MPYTAQYKREKLDTHIDALADAIKKITAESGESLSYAGMLNYSCTTLALKIAPEKRYGTIATISGVFANIGDEFYRRYAAPYEDEQIEKNGDVY